MCIARKLGVPIYQLLGGKVRDTLKVYAWIGGDRPSDVEAQAYVEPSLLTPRWHIRDVLTSGPS